MYIYPSVMSFTGPTVHLQPIPRRRLDAVGEACHAADGSRSLDQRATAGESGWPWIQHHELGCTPCTAVDCSLPPWVSSLCCQLLSEDNMIMKM